MRLGNTNEKHRTIFGYTCAVVSVALALILTRAFGVLYVGLESLFFGAVMITAWVGGLGPALTATVLAGFCSAYFFPDPIGQSRFGVDDAVRLAIFIAMAVLISSLHARTRLSEEQAQSASQAKDRFLAILSHELRNPLNPILTAASMWQQDGTLDATLREDLAMIRRNVELEVRLIDDLLDLNRVSAGKLVLKREPVDVGQLIRQTISVCAADANTRGVRVAGEANLNGVTVNGDPTRLQQILWNLLKNAIKFTPPGGDIRVTGEIDDGRVRLKVIDTGAGIDPQVQARIFNPFEQGGGDVTRQYGGLGLGLAISKMLVEAHGGTIAAQSEGRGRGSTFVVTLPLLAQSPARETQAEVASPAPINGESHHAARSMRILVVEDDADTARAMARLLQARHHAVRTADSVQAALSAAAAARFDLIISDVGLPDGSGLELMRKLKSNYGVRGVAVSGFGMDEDIRQSREAGFEQHLLKPVTIQQLDAVLDHLDD